MKKLVASLILIPLFLMGFIPTNSKKETISEKIAKYDEIPVYISLHSKLFRSYTNFESSESDATKKTKVPSEVGRAIQNHVIDHLNKGFKTDKFKAAFNPKSSQEDWNKSDLKIYMSLEITGEYVLGVFENNSHPVEFKLSVNNYFYEKSKNGYFGKIKSPGYVSVATTDKSLKSNGSDIGYLVKQIKPDILMDDLKKEIDKYYPKWISKQFPKNK